MNCFSRRFAPRCSGCGEVFHPTDLVRKARDLYFHVMCFMCAVCGRQLHTGDQVMLHMYNVDIIYKLIYRYTDIGLLNYLFSIKKVHCLDAKLNYVLKLIGECRTELRLWNDLFSMIKIKQITVLSLCRCWVKFF